MASALAPSHERPRREQRGCGTKRRNLSAFVTTKTDENAMAPAARIGERRMPKAG
jgi:hypothetical protein